MSKILLQKEYHGFESIDELINGEDFCYALEKSDIPGEFQGTLKVTVEYVPAEGEEDE